MHSPARSIFALIPLLWAPPAAASACFDAGIEALDAGRFADAANAFEAAARRDACRSDAVDLRFNAGFALQRLAEQGQPDAACRAVAAYREVVASTPDPELARTARTRMAETQLLCAPEPPAGSGWMLRSAIAAGIAAAGTGVVYALAMGADAERADAKADYVALRRANRPEDAEDARRRFEDARNTTDALGVTAYIGLALSLTLAGLAIGGWLLEDDGATVTVGPGGVGFGVRW